MPVLRLGPSRERKTRSAELLRARTGAGEPCGQAAATTMAIADLNDDRVVNAIMQGGELRTRCPELPRRQAVITAVKTFWRSVYARRQILENEGQD